MKFSLALASEPNDHYVPLAQAAEELGFDAVTIPDSICYPKECDSKYPYNADGSNDFLNGVPFIDPFIQLARLSAVTTKLHFTTAVVKLAVRHPVLVAKMLSSLAVISDNRISLGVGLSPWKEDFEATQIPWERRGKRMDQMIDIINGLMTGEFFSYQGSELSIPEIKLCPVPTIRVPILLGGHGPAALKRAARAGDGWVAAGAEIEELTRMINVIGEHRKEYGRDTGKFEIHTTGIDAYSPEGVAKLNSAGVDLCYVGFHNIYEGKPDIRTLDQKITQLGQYADYVIKPSK
ncbi:MAG: putative F420-dependent oxidoreductase [Pseudomonadales bacterium]|jgi:probable F420-dependent oxidoreductase